MSLNILALLALLLACAACETSSGGSRPSAGASEAGGASPQAPTSSALTEAGIEVCAQAESLDATRPDTGPVSMMVNPAELLTAAPRGGRSLGHTSVVFEVKLANGVRAVFKPSSIRGPKRYKGEIAAYRLAIALGISNVPPAFFRTFSYPQLSTALASELFTKEALANGNEVRGAIIPWIDGLAFADLDHEPMLGRWRAQLRREAVLDAEGERLAPQVSTMVAFDWLTGNWDRWSGGNIGLDKATGQLLFLDNDGAFFEVPPADGLARSRRALQRIEKFSRSFVAHVRGLDRASLEGALGDETPGAPLLSAKALDGVDERRRLFIALVDEKTADGGSILVFP